MAEKARIPKVAIVGSCVSRDPFSVIKTEVGQVASYVARQTFVGLDKPPLAYEPEWYAELNGFEQRCVVTNLTKDDGFWAFENKADVLLVDYIDERFDLLNIDGRFACETRHVMQPGFMARYEKDMTKQARLTPETTELWRAGAALFFERALRTFPAHRIILHEALWAPCLKAADGSLTPFSGSQSKRIEPNNRLLNEYFEITKQLVPGISVIRLSDEAIFADPEHRWSKEPFHYIRRYDEDFLEALAGLTADLR